MALLILQTASAWARVVRIDLLHLAADRLLLGGIVTVGSCYLCDLLTLYLLLDLDMVHHLQGIILDR